MGSNIIPRVEFANTISLGIFILIWFSKLDIVFTLPSFLDLSFAITDVTPGAVVDGRIVEGPETKPYVDDGINDRVLTKNPFLKGYPYVWEDQPLVPLDSDRKWWYSDRYFIKDPVGDVLIYTVCATCVVAVITLAYQIWVR